MELKQFISEALSSIVEGVVGAQSKTKNLGAFVNPGNLMKTSSEISKDVIWDNRTNNVARLISFDIAVTVEEGTKTNAKIGVVAGFLSLGAGGASENKQLAVSRIQFGVPVLLPTLDLPNEAREPKKKK
ncbi:MAG: hypothetical protein JW927_03135 [Deltaproteobacteria bacterium]|nr:hypothetical protein [Deltaproteobacteria bacterium]